MIIYNVTIKIDRDIETDWLQWMKKVHIPDVMSCGIFQDFKLFHLLDQDESDGITFAIQYFCENLKAFKQYETLYATTLKAQHEARYANRYYAFRSLLEEI